MTLALTKARKRGFTVTEQIMTVLVLGVVAGVVTPQFAGATNDERTTKAETIIAGVRGAIDAFARRAAAQNAAPYPSLSELTMPGVVIRDPIPANPFTGETRVQMVSRPQADRRAVVNPGSAGWNYFVDNSIDPPLVIFYANCENKTTAPGADGGTLRANEL